MKAKRPLKPHPAPGAGRKPKDGPVKSNVYADLPLLFAWIATAQGRFAEADTHAAHALLGLAELARRTDLDDINLDFPEGIPRNVHLRKRAEVERAATEAALLLGRFVFASHSAAPARLRDLADLLEARPVQAQSEFLALAPADPNRRAAADLLWQAAEAISKTQTGPISDDDIRRHLASMRPADRLAFMRERGARGDDRVLRRCLQQTLRLTLRPGRPNQSSGSPATTA